MHGTQIDEVFEKLIGGLGVWQVCIIILTAFSFSNNMVLSVFFNAVPSHRCKADPDIEIYLKGFNFTSAAAFIGPIEQIQNYTRQCSRYSGKSNSSTSVIQFYEMARDTGIANNTCFQGYVYQYAEVQYNGGIVKQWDLVCENAWQLPMNEGAYMVGMMIGFILGGWLSDRVGRRKAMLISGLGELIAAILTASSVNHWLYIVARIVLAIFVTARGSAYVILSTEITTAKWRSVLAAIGMILQIIIQGTMLGLLAKYVTDWRLFTILNNIPGVLVTMHIWLLPESPRWLAATGNAEKAAKILFSAYIINSRFKKPKPDHVMTFDEFQMYLGLGPNGNQEVILRNIRLRAIYSSTENTGEFAIWQLFKPRHVKVTMLSTLILTCQITCIFGMVFFANNINIHVSFVTIVNSVAQIPGCILAALLYRYFRSRKLPLIIVYAIVIVLGVVAAIHTMCFRPSTDRMLNMYSNFIILFLSSAQRMLFIYVPELYRPIYRNRGFGLAAGMARIGALSFPLINRLDKAIVHGFPLIIYTAIVVLQLVLIILMNDTTGKAKRSTIIVTHNNDEMEVSEPLPDQGTPPPGLWNKISSKLRIATSGSVE